MLAKPTPAGLLAVLVAASALLLSACSSSHPRDINWGTDAGWDFVPPDLGNSDTSSTSIDGSIDSSPIDGGDQVDVAIATNN